VQSGPALILVLVSFLCAACSVVAILVQQSLLPSGLFNAGQREYDLLSRAVLVLFSMLVLIFGLELLRRRITLLGNLARVSLASFLLFELAVTVFDIGWVSRDPRSRFAGPYFERPMRSGEWIFLRKAPEGSEFGFRMPRAEPRVSPVPRVLFLGDSYTEGSGSDFACNYPSVVESALTRRLGDSVDVMNAGVGGYGPVDEWKMLRFLDEEGFRFDAIVLNLFLENDFVDYLPGTERRVVAGMNFRYPTSSFLRAFHPLNSRVVRYAVFLWRTAPLVGPPPAPISVDPTRCQEAPETTVLLDDALRPLVERRLKANYEDPMTALTLAEVKQAVTSIEEFAAARGVPLVLVVFPDRIVADAELRSALRLDERGVAYDLTRLQRWVREAFPQLPQIDVNEVLAGSSGSYIPNDTHLSDVGNVRAGEFVADRLAEILGPRLRRDSPSGPGESPRAGPPARTDR
jgi:hypothetical protein